MGSAALVALALLGTALEHPATSAEGATLPDAPRAQRATAPPGTGGTALQPQAAAAAGGWLDTNNRTAVLNAYQSTFGPAVPAPAWTGNIGSCNAGTLAAAHRANAFSRVNWYRSMAGVPAGVVEEPTFSTRAQQAALITAANNLSNPHAPPATATCYSAEGARGAADSNLYRGLSGPPAIDGFMQDPGAGNQRAGHRAWILDPTQVRMGFGSIPATPQAAALYIQDELNMWNPSPPLRQPAGFVSWPPTGFVPNTKVYPRWTLHKEGADFTSAVVKVTVGGVQVSSPVEHRGTPPPPNSSAKPLPVLTFVPALPAFPASGDLVVSVTVTGIGGSGVPSSYSWTTTAISPTAPRTRPPADFNGDGKPDFGAYRPSTGGWYVAFAGGGTTSASWGLSTDVPVPGDYNADGKADFGVYRPSNGGWLVALAGGGTTSASWGLSTDVPVPGDYNGDGKTDFGVYRPSTGGWLVALAGGGTTSATCGLSTDVPVPGDYNGDGKTDFGVYRPSTGGWLVALAGRGTTSATWGLSTDVPVPGDYNGDGKTDFGVYRPSTRAWSVSFTGGGTTSASWGSSGGIPVPGDYNGDGRTDFGVYRPSTGGWYVAFAGGGSTSASWGASGDVPLPLPHAIRSRFFGPA